LCRRNDPALQHELANGVRFFGDEEEGRLLGVRGVQHVQDLTLFRHAYVRATAQVKAAAEDS
jgi:hypothetical protein